jgi:hypothetical protein
MEVKRKKCIFCELVGSSREHVISDWILELLNIKGDSVTFNQRKTFLDSENKISFKNELKRTMKYNSYRSNYVCQSCNNGWMCRLEADVKPILTPLIKGERHPKSLTKEEKVLLALWMAKTTCVIDSVDPSENPSYIAADPNEIRRMESLPHGWAVFATTHTPTREFSYECNSKWCFVGNPSNPDKKLLPNLRRTSIQIGKLILVSAYLGNAALRLRAVRNKHFAIGLAIPVEWIKKPYGVWICGEDLPLDSSENIQAKFAGSLSLRAI